MAAARSDEDGFGVNRLTLREILLTDIDVHFGAQFERYESTSDGRVRAMFRDGSAAVGDLLVGADGTNSAVRSQLLPTARITGLECAAYGRTLIGDDPLDWLPHVLTDSFNRVTGPGGAGMAVATCRTREPLPTAVAPLAPHATLTDVAAPAPVAATSAATAVQTPGIPRRVARPIMR